MIMAKVNMKIWKPRKWTKKESPDRKLWIRYWKSYIPPEPAYRIFLYKAIAVEKSHYGYEVKLGTVSIRCIRKGYRSKRYISGTMCKDVTVKKCKEWLTGAGALSYNLHGSSFYVDSKTSALKTAKALMQGIKFGGAYN